MRNFLLTLFLATGFFSAYSQIIPPDNVPQVVKDSLLREFKKRPKSVTWSLNPKANTWTVKDDTLFEATYNEKFHKKVVSYSKTGQWVQSITAFDVEKLPTQVTEAATRTFPEIKILKAWHLETSLRGYLYELEVTTETHHYLIRYDGSGMLVGRVDI